MVDRKPIAFSSDNIQFKVIEGKKKLSGSINMTNVSSSPIIFKIKTTTHDRYAVKPSVGLIEPNGNYQVTIMLLIGEVGDVSSVNDKFQVQYLSVLQNFSFSEDKLALEFKQNRGKELKQNFHVTIVNDYGKIINVQKNIAVYNRDIGLKGKIQPQEKVAFESAYNKSGTEPEKDNFVSTGTFDSQFSNSKQFED